MKLNPTLLFLLSTIFFLFVGLLNRDKSLDIPLHDAYFIVSYLDIALLFSFFTGIMMGIYFGLEKINRPIKYKTGLWHFGLFVGGLLLIFFTITWPENSYNVGSMISSLIVLLVMGIILLAASLIVFIYGLTKAISNQKL